MNTSKTKSRVSLSIPQPLEDSTSIPCAHRESTLDEFHGERTATASETKFTMVLHNKNEMNTRLRESTFSFCMAASSSSPSTRTRLRLPVEEFRAAVASLEEITKRSHEASRLLLETNKLLREDLQQLQTLQQQSLAPPKPSTPETKKLADLSVQIHAAINKLASCEKTQQLVSNQITRVHDEFERSEAGIIRQLTETHDQLTALRRQRARMEPGAGSSTFDYQSTPDNSALYMQDCFQ